MQEALTKFYESIAPQLLNVMPTGREISSPLFLSVLHGYAIAKRRLLIVGQETYTWFGSIDELKQHPNPARKMQERYEAFNLGEGCLRYPFWSIAHQIQKKLEAYVPAFGFMWSNLFACDEKKRTPSPARPSPLAPKPDPTGAAPVAAVLERTGAAPVATVSDRGGGWR